MNKIIIGVIIVLIVIGGGIYFVTKNNASQPQVQMQTTRATQKASEQNVVTIQNFAFSPATLTVKVGDKVTWTNQDSVGHSATADNGSFDTGVLSQGQSGSFTFTKAGTYAYHCSVHPMMHGMIIVQ